jgi:hypothetical protein
MHFVYILQNIDRPDQYSTGLCKDVLARLNAHNAGQCPHTANSSRGASFPIMTSSAGDALRIRGLSQERPGRRSQRTAPKIAVSRKLSRSALPHRQCDLRRQLPFTFTPTHRLLTGGLPTQPLTLPSIAPVDDKALGHRRLAFRASPRARHLFLPKGDAGITRPKQCRSSKWPAIGPRRRATLGSPRMPPRRKLAVTAEAAMRNLAARCFRTAERAASASA